MHGSEYAEKKAWIMPRLSTSLKSVITTKLNMDGWAKDCDPLYNGLFDPHLLRSTFLPGMGYLFYQVIDWSSTN
ncbi:hypothetical protein Prudu_021018 [Prunus dulcis]|uniref:Uncharacterized protein n=1 Tax=Prunus dulcis TaxID=3755 RepID=A0A4Y1RWI1_PRUDU|nr:hypothetical protein Prudu_021018 [Prunus dulcis]